MFFCLNVYVDNSASRRRRTYEDWSDTTGSRARLHTWSTAGTGGYVVTSGAVCQWAGGDKHFPTACRHWTRTHVCLSVCVSLSVCLSVFVFMLCVMPRYLAADCVPVSEVAQRRHLCSAAGHQLVVPSELMWLLGVLCTRSETVELSA